MGPGSNSISQSATKGRIPTGLNSALPASANGGAERITLDRIASSTTDGGIPSPNLVADTSTDGGKLCLSMNYVSTTARDRAEI